MPQAPLFSPNQPVQCTDAFTPTAGIPDPAIGQVYHVAAVHLVGNRYGIELREYPRVGNEAFAFDENAFAPLDAQADGAIAQLLAQSFAPRPACAPVPLAA